VVVLLPPHPTPPTLLLTPAPPPHLPTAPPMTPAAIAGAVLGAPQDCPAYACVCGGKASGALVAAPQDCTLFVTCDGAGQGRAAECAAGFGFNPVAGACQLLAGTPAGAKDCKFGSGGLFASLTTPAAAGKCVRMGVDRPGNVGWTVTGLHHVQGWGCNTIASYPPPCVYTACQRTPDIQAVAVAPHLQVCKYLCRADQYTVWVAALSHMMQLHVLLRCAL
jgi:hypothetical protein